MDIKKFSLFLEGFELEEVKDGNKPTYSSKNLVSEICISMILINNSFLDSILDAGQFARYNENSQVFITDLKNMLLSRNRLSLGKFVDNKCIIDDETSKINRIFEEIDFDIKKDWDKLTNSRNIARVIIDKLIPDSKLNSDDIARIYWIGPNKTKEYNEDIVIELTSGTQYSFFLNKNVSSSKTASFNTFADDLMGSDMEKLYTDRNSEGWDKLVQRFTQIIYENAKKPFQIHIEKYIEPSRIETLSWFDFFNITHSDNRFKYLGEYVKEFDKNISKFSELLNEIWKNRDVCFMDPNLVYNEWMKVKVFVLNSRILEHSLTESLTKNNLQDITKLEDGFKLADGNIKMKLVKTIVDKLNSLERTTYYLGNNGKVFTQIPSRDFFRRNYDKMTIKFDYHVKMVVDENEEENNDFVIKIILDLDNEKLLNCNINVKFTGGISSKLSAKYQFNFASDFNNRVS